MPRSSRHKSSHHRQHRRRERSDSDSEEERKQQRSDSEGPEKRKVASLVESPEKKSGLEGRYAGKNVDLSVVGERRNGDCGVERKEEVDGEKVGKVRLLAGEKDKEKESRRYAEKEKDKEKERRRYAEKEKEKEKERRRYAEKEKEKERRRRDGDEMREKERSGRENFHDKGRDKDAEKDRRMEKELERERRTKRGRDEIEDREREREVERDRDVKDVARKKSSDGISKRTGSGGGDREKVKGSTKYGDQQEYNEIHNSDLDKDISRKTRRKGYSGSKDELHEVDKDDCERRLPLTDDWTKNGGVKDEKYAEDCKREKYREDYDRKGRTQLDKHQDGRYARDQFGNRPENKLSKEVDKISENHNKKTRSQENWRANSPYFDEHMDKKDKKRSSDDLYLQNDPKPQDKKENQGMEIITSEVNHSRNKSEKHKSMDAADTYPKTKHPKITPQDAKSKYSLEQVNSTKKEMSPEDKIHKDSASLGDPACEKIQRINSASSGVSESHSLERTINQKEYLLDDFLEQSAPSSRTQVTPRSLGHPSPSQLSEKQSSCTGRRHSNRSGEERERRTSLSNDERGHSTIEKWRDFSLGRQESANGSLDRDLPNGDSLPIGSFSSNRADHLFGCSASPLRSSSARHGTCSPASGSEGDRFQAGERKHNGRSSRIGDPNFGRGHGNSLKGVFNWPSPMGNGFVPFQHGHPSGGFYPVVQPFPVPSMFGVRPSMDLNQSGIPFFMNEASNRLSGHARPYGWGDHGDDPFPPNIQAWEGSNNMFGDGYGNSRFGWEQKNHLATNPGSEMRKDSLEEQNECLSMQSIDSKKEAVVSNIPGCNEQSQTDDIEIKGSQDTQSRIQTHDNGVSVKIPNETSKLSDNDGAAYFNVYLSNLDISFDLAQPELYHRYNKTVGVKGNISNITTTAPENLEGKVPLRSSSRLFPILSDSIFQRAICLYKKDSGAKTKFLTSNPNKEVASHASKIDSVAKLSPDAKLENANLSNTMEEVNNLPTLQADAEDLVSSKYSDAKGIYYAKEGFLNDVNILENADPSSCMEENTDSLGTLVADVDVVSPGHTVVKEIDPVEKFSSPDNNLLGNADPFSRMEGIDNLSSLKVVDSSDVLNKDKPSSSMCTADDCAAEGSPVGCVVLMPDCRVTLSRIHHSPESTH